VSVSLCSPLLVYCVNSSFGLSDLHGDGRVHDVSGPETPSGFGFELTFRLKREPGETAPPTWPAAVMQALAKYVFQSGMVTSVTILLPLLGLYSLYWYPMGPRINFIEASSPSFSWQSTYNLHSPHSNVLIGIGEVL